MNLSCSDCAQSSSLRNSITPPGAEPALLTRMSMRPSALCASLTKCSASSGRVRSAGIGTILRLVSRAISPATASSGSGRRAHIATSTPSPASARAIALPIPALPPVTSAHLPLSFRSISRPRCLSSRRDQQKHRAVALLGPFRMGGDLLIVRPPFLEVHQRKPEPDQQTDDGADRAVLLVHSRRQPIDCARSFGEIAV